MSSRSLSKRKALKYQSVRPNIDLLRYSLTVPNNRRVHRETSENLRTHNILIITTACITGNPLTQRLRLAEFKAATNRIMLAAGFKKINAPKI